MNFFSNFFKNDLPATFSAGKWKINIIKNKNKLINLKSQHNIYLTSLGNKIWHENIYNENYHELYNQLMQLKESLENIKKQISNTVNDINDGKSHFDKIKNESDNKINEIQNYKQVEFSKLNELKQLQNKNESEMLKIQKNLNDGPDNINNLYSVITKSELSNDSDKANKINSIKTTIKSIQEELNNAPMIIENIKNEINNNLNNQKPHIEKIKIMEQDIFKLKENQKLQLNPIENTLNELHNNLKQLNVSENEILNLINKNIPILGELAYTCRPSTEKLINEYVNLDNSNNAIQLIENDINLSEARLSTVSSRSIVKVSIFGIVVLCILLIPIIIGLEHVSSNFIKKGATENPTSSSGTQSEEITTAEFIDNTRNYKNKIIVFTVFVRSGYRIGNNCQFYNGRHGVNLNLTVYVPPDIQAPNVGMGDRVTLAFICTSGSLTQGNKAISIERTTSTPFEDDKGLVSDP